MDSTMKKPLHGNFLRFRSNCQLDLVKNGLITFGLPALCFPLIGVGIVFFSQWLRMT